jgi:ubiquinone/menaquinone biosynthesis C-methylase UbiE
MVTNKLVKIIQLCLLLVLPFAIVICMSFYQEHQTYTWFSSELPTEEEVEKSWNEEKRFNNLYKLSRWDGFLSGAHFNRFVREQIKGLGKNKTSKFRFLEVGVGVGAFASEILKMYPFSKGEGIDVVPGAISIAKVSLPKERMIVKLGDMRNIDYDNNAFDVVYVPGSICYLTFIEDVKKAVSEFYRVLKPNGGVCLSMIASDTSPVGSCNIRIPKTFWTSLHGFMLLNMEEMDKWRLPHSSGRYSLCMRKNAEIISV